MLEAPEIFLLGPSHFCDKVPGKQLQRTRPEKILPKKSCRRGGRLLSEKIGAPKKKFAPDPRQPLGGRDYPKISKIANCGCEVL